MAFTGKAGASAGAKKGRMTLPTKRTVNLAGVGKKQVKLGVAIPAVILIIVAAILFSKFAVIDRLIKVSEAEAAVAEVQRKIDEGNARIRSFEELSEIYPHYTFSGMTEEELARVSRVEVVDLITRVIAPEAYVESFSVIGNSLTVSVTDNTLQDINLIAQKLLDEKIVSYCTVTTAATNDRDLSFRKAVEEAGLVTASINIFLTLPAEEEVSE